MNPLLTDESLKKFIGNIKLDDGQKSTLISRLPQMDEKQRLEFLDVLKNVYLLDLEEKEAIKKLSDNWQK